MLQKNWQDLIKPEKLVTEAGVDASRTATIVAEPLERGFGLTLGNALRRVLLSSLQGAAVTSIKIDNVLHEFSSIPGVREDVVDIVLNIKAMAVKMQGDRPQRLYLRAVGPGEVTAGMIELPGDVQIMDPKHLICTLDDGASISMELMVATGKGYSAVLGRNLPRRLGNPVPANEADEALLAKQRDMLLAARAKRAAPTRDDRVMADWNGMAIAAIARAGKIFDKPEWIAAATTAFDGIINGNRFVNDDGDKDNTDPKTPPKIDEDFLDGHDNDGDGLVDCRDPDCLTGGNCGIVMVPPRMENTLALCSDGGDNDGNGYKRILFVDGSGERKAIYLGKMPVKAAEKIMVLVEALNAASITNIAINNSHADASICEPTMRAFTKYSSLWMITKNASEAMAAGSE